MNIVGFLPIIREGNRYIIVAIDYFLRWLKVRLLKVANTNTVVIFLYEKIICKFEVSRILQSDRGTYFINKII